MKREAFNKMFIGFTLISMSGLFGSCGNQTEVEEKKPNVLIFVPIAQYQSVDRISQWTERSPKNAILAISTQRLQRKLFFVSNF